jgi:leucyl/phenylalanyl-tRNA--protein transferase
MPVFQLSRDIVFPSPELAEPDGLIAVGGDLSPERIMEAYRSGIFPWYSEGDPILWWTPSPRLILFPEEFYISRRLARTIRQNVFSVSADSSFEKVITNCAEQRSENRNETWITQEMISAYCHLHELGYAHSIECWKDDKLVGGLYGIALDHVFFGESMFSNMSNSSKVALNALVQHAKETGIHLIDCQMRTEHLASLGAREISRTRFEELLNKNIRETTPQQKWRLH